MFDRQSLEKYCLLLNYFRLSAAANPVWLESCTPIGCSQRVKNKPQKPIPVNQICTFFFLLDLQSIRNF